MVQGAHQIFGVNRFCSEVVTVIALQQQATTKANDRVIVCDRDAGYHDGSRLNFQRHSGLRC